MRFAHIIWLLVAAFAIVISVTVSVTVSVSISVTVTDTVSVPVADQMPPAQTNTTPLIVGGIVGALGFLVAVASAICCYSSCHKKARQEGTRHGGQGPFGRMDSLGSSGSRHELVELGADGRPLTANQPDPMPAELPTSANGPAPVGQSDPVQLPAPALLAPSTGNANPVGRSEFRPSRKLSLPQQP